MGCLSKDKVKNFNQTPLSFHTHPLLSETNMIHIHIYIYIIIYIYITSNSGSIAPSYNLPSWFISPTFPNFTQPHQLHQPTSGAFLFLRAVKMADSFIRFSRSAPAEASGALGDVYQGDAFGQLLIPQRPVRGWLVVMVVAYCWWWWWYWEVLMGGTWWLLMIAVGWRWVQPVLLIHLGSQPKHGRFFRGEKRVG